MKTKLLKENQYKEAAEIIRQGGTVVFRTETVYGLGADATNPSAVEKIFEAKNRPAVNPLIVHFASLDELVKRFSDICPKTIAVLRKVQHAITVILPRPSWIPLITTGGLDTVAVRVPSCAFARKFIAECAVPLAAPSANTSTRPSPTRWQDAYEDLDGRVDAILCGGQTQIGLESTVVKIHNDTIQVLRLGGISTHQLELKTGYKVTYNPTNESPGTRFRHYSPKCPLYVTYDVAKYPNATVLENSHFGSSAREIAKNLFKVLRDTEKTAEAIVVKPFPNTIEYQAINERIRKAAE